MSEFSEILTVENGFIVIFAAGMLAGFFWASVFDLIRTLSGYLYRKLKELREK